MHVCVQMFSNEGKFSYHMGLRAKDVFDNAKTTPFLLWIETSYDTAKFENWSIQKYSEIYLLFEKSLREVSSS